MDWFGYPWYIWVLIVLVTGFVWGFGTTWGAAFAQAVASLYARRKERP